MERSHVKNLLLPRLFNTSIALLAALFFIGGFFNPLHAANSRGLANLFSTDSAAVLKPEEAFKLQLRAIDAQTIEGHFSIAPGHYLYRDRIKFSVLSSSQLKITDIKLPAGEIKEDANFGTQEVYHRDFTLTIKLSAASQNTTLLATYQGCSEKGLCYAPIKNTLSVNLDKASPAAPLIVDNETDSSTRLLQSGNVWLTIGGFFLAGLLLSMTPCVLPMIPILSSIIVGQLSSKSSPSKWHGFALSLAYVLGMALSYALAGVAAGLTGNLLSVALQNPWVLGSTAVLFVLLACAMFGLYELKLPQAFEDQMLQTSNRMKGGRFIGVFAMGALSALIVSPCVAAPLAGALIYIGQTHDVLLGGIGLFALGLGMGMPLLLLGASAGSLLPKTGDWMNGVRNLFGVVMLAMAIWLISPLLPMAWQLSLWAVLFIVTAVYHQALDRLPAHATNAAKLGKGVAIILLLLGVALLIGALSGAKSASQPLANLFSTSKSAGLPSGKTLVFERIKSVTELDYRLAHTQGRPVMLDFYADWCVACKELEQLTFSDKKVQRQLKDTALLQADVTANSDDDKALLKRFGLYGPPGIVFFNAGGQEMRSLQTVGFQNAERFSKVLLKRDGCLSDANAQETVAC
ncbi:MAG: protein-disulfide reductase DsbD [Methylotenera sp.]|nr:protein-disulfide reductase DsbD [Methylotenera sp.]